MGSLIRVNLHVQEGHEHAEMALTMRQRLVDPELCSACLACFEACPRGAIVVAGRRVAIDPALCGHCGDCVRQCASTAIDTVVDTPGDAPWTIAEQLAWDRLPPDGARD